MLRPTAVFDQLARRRGHLVVVRLWAIGRALKLAPMKRSLRLILFCAAGTTLFAQSPSSTHTYKLDAPAHRPAAKLAALAWFEGHWTANDSGTTADEIWTGVNGASLLGMFRIVKDGKVQLYEIITVVETGGSLEMRLKHFSGAMKGWEEKEKFVSFPLVKLEGRTAWFDGITYQLDADGTLRVWLLEGRKGAPPEEAEFVFHRASTGP